MITRCSHTRRSGFTLVETVIAIGVLTVLLTGFMYVFAPAAAGIKQVIRAQEAERLVATFEQELVTLRGNTEQTTYKTGFNKAFDWLKGSNTANTALLVYQYRGSVSSQRADGTPEPIVDSKGKLPGVDYILQPMVRKKGDAFFVADLAAIEGGVYYVKCTQLIFKNSQLTPGTVNQISDPKTGNAVATPDNYLDATIAFTADFYQLNNVKPTSYEAVLTSSFAKTGSKPVFSRNLAARR